MEPVAWLDVEGLTQTLRYVQANSRSSAAHFYDKTADDRAFVLEALLHAH